jgi:hypothetical protein
VTIMEPSNQTEFWRKLGSHKFGIAMAGMGWDTYRLWELLFMGTVPIVISGSLDTMYTEAHLPVIVVKKWSDVCRLTDRQMDEYASRYETWTAELREWLYPSVWVPRDQRRFDELCLQAIGCRKAPKEMGGLGLAD